MLQRKVRTNRWRSRTACYLSPVPHLGRRDLFMRQLFLLLLVSDTAPQGVGRLSPVPENCHLKLPPHPQPPTHTPSPIPLVSPSECRERRRKALCLMPVLQIEAILLQLQSQGSRSLGLRGVVLVKRLRVKVNSSPRSSCTMQAAVLR